MQDIHHVLTSTAKILWRSRHGQEWPGRHISEEFINDQSSKFLCQEFQQVAFMDSSCVVEIVIALTTQRPWVIRLENDRSDMCLNV